MKEVIPPTAAIVSTWDPFMSPNSLDLVASVKCRLAMKDMYAVLMNTLQAHSAEENLLTRLKTLLAIDHDVSTMVERCKDSLKKQFNVLQDTLAVAQTQASRHCNDSCPIIASQDQRPENENKFVPATHTPFSWNFNHERCFEPLWCDHTVEMQKRIHAWQHPSVDRPVGSYNLHIHHE